MRLSLRGTLIGICLFFVLTIANVIYRDQQLPTNPYTSGGVLSAMIAKTQAENRHRHANRYFWYREIGAAVLSLGAIAAISMKWR